jgi:D-alanine transaminase
MQTIPDTLCYLNGEYSSLRDAKVSVLDRGFIFGDGLYEVIPAYNCKLFRFEEHMARLSRSLVKLRIHNPHTSAEWLERCQHLIQALILKTQALKNETPDQLIYIQVTRGVAVRDHVMPTDITPTVFIMCSVMKPPSAQQRHQGVNCITARDFRWERGDIKSTSLLGNVLARQLSADQGAAETILFRNGFLTEGASTNVWVVREGALLGPPKSEHLLEGIRYDLIRDLCTEVSVPYHLRPVSEADVMSADEVLLSSSVKEVLPVTHIDTQAVGHGALRGKPGPVYARLFEAYQRAKSAYSV